jgi:hypothetical protein
MTERALCPPAPGPLEAFAAEFDPLFGALAQRRGFREYLQGLLLPRDRNKTLTALAGAEPVVGAQAAPVQRLQFFLSESTWDAEAVNARRLELLFADPVTRPHGRGVLILDDSGDRKDGSKTDHVARQYLGSVGKVDNGIVAVTSVWADERVYYPLHLAPYTPAGRLPKGKKDPGFRTKPRIALALVDAALEMGADFRAVVADCAYGESEDFEGALWEADLPFVVALKPSKGSWAPAEAAHTPKEAAAELGWEGPEEPGDWTRVEREFRDGHRETWWAAGLTLAGYGPDKSTRLVAATTDPATLPDASSWYLATNLPRPGSPRADGWPVSPADLAEVVRLYGLRNWVEQGYKQVKDELGWADFMVRKDRAIRRHWQLVCCAFSFCWWAWARHPADVAPPPTPVGPPAPAALAGEAPHPIEDPASGADAPPERGGKGGGRPRRRPPARPELAGGAAPGPRLAGPLDHARALLARLVQGAPAAGTPGPPRLGRQRQPAQPLPPMLTNYR